MRAISEVLNRCETGAAFESHMASGDSGQERGGEHRRGAGAGAGAAAASGAGGEVDIYESPWVAGYSNFKPWRPN